MHYHMFDFFLLKTKNAETNSPNSYYNKVRGRPEKMRLKGAATHLSVTFIHRK